MRLPRRFAVLVVVAMLASACGDEATEQTPSTPPSIVLPPLPGGDVGGTGEPPPLDQAGVDRGRPLYQQYCASCHGGDGEGQEDWMTANPDGSFKAPPHDASGHTWHHPDSLLVGIINGTERFEGAVMPGFGEALTDDEIRDVLEYIKAWWGPDERRLQWQVSQRNPG